MHGSCMRPCTVSPVDAKVCGGLRAEKHRGAWLDEVLGYVQ